MARLSGILRMIRVASRPAIGGIIFTFFIYLTVTTRRMIMVSGWL